MMGKSVERRAVSRVYDFRKNRDTESALRKVSVMKAVWTFLNYLIFERIAVGVIRFLKIYSVQTNIFSIRRTEFSVRNERMVPRIEWICFWGGAVQKTMSARGFCIFSDLSSGYDHLPNKSDQKRLRKIGVSKAICIYFYSTHASSSSDHISGPEWIAQNGCQ